MDMSVNTYYIHIWKDLARWDVILMIFDCASIVTRIVCLNRRWSFLVDKYKIFRASLEWLLQYVNISIILAPKLMSHVCARLIDNTGNYLSLNNGSSKFEVDPHQFNLRLHHFPQFQRKKYFQKLAGLWLAGEIVSRIGIYGAKMTEGLSASQRRTCFLCTLPQLCQSACTIHVENGCE